MRRPARRDMVNLKFTLVPTDRKLIGFMLMGPVEPLARTSTSRRQVFPRQLRFMRRLLRTTPTFEMKIGGQQFLITSPRRAAVRWLSRLQERALSVRSWAIRRILLLMWEVGQGGELIAI